MFGIGRGIGPLVVHALRQKVGDDTFRRIIGTYLDRYRDGSASSADFVEIVDRVAGAPAGEYLQDWLYGSKTPPMPGHPDW